MLHHQKANDGNGKLERGLAPHFEVPTDFDAWHYAMQLNQARAVAFGIEHFRSLRPRCLGTIVWQLNDCWPVTSWAAIDGYGRRKPLWHALKAAYAERLLTLQPAEDGDGLALIAVNDGPSAWREPFTIRRVSFSGEVLAEHRSRLTADRLGAATLVVPAEVATPGDPATELLVAETAGGIRALHFFAEDRDLAYPPARFEADAVRQADGSVVVTIGATTLVRELVIAADRVHPDADASTALLTLLPGESAQIVVTGVPEGSEAELLVPPVLLTADRLAVAAEVNA
jgi:beta-mannosidase